MKEHTPVLKALYKGIGMKALYEIYRYNPPQVFIAHSASAKITI
jgi:hypothetical protein